MILTEMCVEALDDAAGRLGFRDQEIDKRAGAVVFGCFRVTLFFVEIQMLPLCKYLFGNKV